MSTKEQYYEDTNQWLAYKYTFLGKKKNVYTCKYT